MILREGRGSKLIRVRSKAQVERGGKKERDNNEIKFLTELIRHKWKAKWSKTEG